jgi:AcrR family transcriptional regulator
MTETEWTVKSKQNSRRLERVSIATAADASGILDVQVQDALRSGSTRTTRYRSRRAGRMEGTEMAEHTLTAKGAATRQRIVDGAATLIRGSGPAATSLDDIMAATSTSKSQLFHYFPDGRDELFRAVARHEASQVIAAQQPYLSDLTSWRKWQAWRRAVIAHYTELGSRCPLGALTSQLGKSSPQTREIVSDLYDEWETLLRTGAQAMADRGELAPDVSAAQTARGILAAIQGGVVMLQSTGRVDYLDAGVKLALRPMQPSDRVALR